jgi:hypothetical protein
MNDIEPDGDAERTKQIVVAGWTTGVFAVVAGITLVNVPTWPVAFGIATIATMLTVIFCYVLKKN